MIGEDQRLRAEEESIRVHHALAEKLRDDPARIIAMVAQNIARWQKIDRGTANLARWEALLNGPLDELLAFMVSPSQDARDMREETPFAVLLSWLDR